MIAGLLVAVNLMLTGGSLCTADHQDFDGYRYKEQIAHCKRNVAYSLKTYVYKMYDIDLKYRKNYTIDHFYPLSLGGDNSFSNLWPQHKSIHSGKCEGDLYRKVSSGQMTAQRARDILYDLKVLGGKCENK